MQKKNVIVIHTQILDLKCPGTIEDEDLNFHIVA